MNTKHNHRTQRFLAAGLLLILLVGVLAGCASSGGKSLTLADNIITKADDGAMSGDQLKATAQLLVDAFDEKNFNTFDRLIAASRGYNMQAEGFDDTQVDPSATGTDDPIAAAIALMDAANDQVKDSKKIARDQYAGMNQADLSQLIGLFQAEVDPAAKGGALDVIEQAIGTFLRWLTQYLGFGSYIVGICVFAIIVEILMLPFAVKQQKNSIKQAKLRPKEMAIRNKYAGRNDQKTQQKVQQEIQELYQRENFSPYSGCLPLLLQFPILIILYNIVVDPLHYVLGQASQVSTALSSYYTAARAAGGLGQAMQSSRSTIELLSGGLSRFSGIQNFAYYKNGAEIWSSLEKIGDSMPNFNIFKWNFGLTPSFEHFDVLLLVPVLTFAVYFASMKLSRKFSYQPTQAAGADDRQVACSNSMMDVTMPLMSTFFAFLVPAIVGVYWMFRSIIGTLKQFIMSRIMPIPTFTEEDYKAAAKELAGKKPKVQKSENVGKVRSLHHIDDEDYEDTRERALARKAAIEAREQEEKAKKAGKFAVDAPEMKEDNTHAKSEEKTTGSQNTASAEPTGENAENDKQEKD